MDGVAFIEDLLPGILQNTTGREQWVSRATPFDKIVIVIDTKNQSYTIKCSLYCSSLSRFTILAAVLRMLTMKKITKPSLYLACYDTLKVQTWPKQRTKRLA